MVKCNSLGRHLKDKLITVDQAVDMIKDVHQRLLALGTKQGSDDALVQSLDKE